MKKHTKVYMQYFGYGIEDFIPCELCGARAVDIHHISSRGMGGTQKEETINNLMALCRPCHLEYGDIKHHIEYLNGLHNVKIEQHKSKDKFR